ncbi:rab-interacting lysosomal protein isoform X4 [Falco naumanni]|uniref:rab-interacting lysosomal protein isoform X4 n=1 Tax=Falco naumanni TaxID=148594 RepID=UPI001ADEA182|nr:rab-interacting lysosomal protein isoform X4 [Falco naumanni]
MAPTRLPRRRRPPGTAPTRRPAPLPGDGSDLAAPVAPATRDGSDPAALVPCRPHPAGDGSDPAAPVPPTPGRLRPGCPRTPHARTAPTRLPRPPAAGAGAVGCRAPGASPAQPPGLPGGAEPAALGAACGEPVPGSMARKEREVMLRLKEVVDKQRDQLRAQAHEIVCKSRDTEALQEQLHRFMAMNEELRHKVAVVQAQLKSTLEKKSDLEAMMLQTQRETSRRSGTASEIQPPKPSLEGAPSPAEELRHQDAHCCFSKDELQQILQERNELKTNLFLVQEELAYYQRELLNEERVPSFFLDAMKSTIKRQRKKIRAKMLGTVEESASSFGLWYQDSSKDPPTSSCSGTWEIIDSRDTQLEPEGESEPVASSPDRATPPL